MNYTWIIIIALYILLSHLIAQYLGTKRRIGYGQSIMWSVLFSPIIGLVATLLSEKTEEK